MANKVFISWSGDLSQSLAKAITDWLPMCVQHLKPFFSAEDIDKGKRWDAEIAKQLGVTDMGILCMTPNNVEATWIHFEAGALSKTVGKSRVCPLLFDLVPTDLEGPLSSFQATEFNKDDFSRLIGSMNDETGESKLDVNVLQATFEKFWPELESTVQDILNSSTASVRKVDRSQKDLIVEILEKVRKLPTDIEKSQRTIYAENQTLIQPGQPYSHGPYILGNVKDMPNYIVRGLDGNELNLDDFKVDKKDWSDFNPTEQRDTPFEEPSSERDKDEE